MAQVKGDGVRAQEYPTGHLAVAEPLGHQVGDAPLGVGQAVPAEGRPVRVAPMAEAGARRAHAVPHPRHAIGSEPLVEGMSLT